MNITNEIISCQQKAFAYELQLRKIYQQPYIPLYYGKKSIKPLF